MQDETPLTRMLTEQGASPQANPIDALRLGRKRWLEGERIQISAIATELGINRATLFRWVGNKDLYLGEVIWSFYKTMFDRIVARTESPAGPDFVVDVCEQLVNEMIDSEPLHTFIRQDPEYAIRILTSKTSIVQSRSIRAIAQMIRDQTGQSEWHPPLAPDDLAYLLARIAESFLYGDVISGQVTDVRHTSTAFRLLVSAPQK